MSNINYPTKPISGDGGTRYVLGRSLPADELQGDFDVVATTVNGNLDEDNLRVGTQIPRSKLAAFLAASIGGDVIDDHSDSAATALTETTPGDSATAGSNLATDIEGELERLRYRIHALTRYRGNSSYRTSSGTYASTSWMEPPVVGENLIRNSAFEYHGGTSTEAPASWVLSGSPTNVAIESPAHSAAGVQKRSLNIVSDASNEGILQTLVGLKSTTKYVLGVSYTVTAGGLNMSTSGAVSTGDYRNGTLTDSIAIPLVRTLQLVVQTDASGSDVSLLIASTVSGSDFNLHDTWCYELSDSAPHSTPWIPAQTAIHNAAEVLPAAFSTPDVWNWETVAELSLSQFIPGPGYRIVYEVDLVYTGALGPTYSGTSSSEFQQSAFRVQMDSGGGAATVDGPKLIWHSTNSGGSNHTLGGTISLKHIVDSPTPGLTYAFTTDVGAWNESGRDDQAVMISPLSTDGTVQSVSRSRLIVERV